MSIKHIFVDMDGVLCDFHHGFQELCGVEDPIPGHKWPETFTLQDHVGLPYDKCREKSKEAPVEFWRTLPASEYGIMIAMACDRFAKQLGAHLSILTDTSDSHFSALGKVAWLHDHLPLFAPRCCLTTDKTGFANYDTLLIDDTHSVAEAFHKAGGRAIVIPQVWNQWRIAYGAPRVPKINALLARAEEHRYADKFFLYDAKSYRAYDRG